MIFQIGKTRLRLSFSFVALIVLMIILCEERVVLYSLVSSLIHESGHLFIMCILGDVPKNVELTLFGMRIDRAGNIILSYKKEIFIALGGIIFNIVFALLCLALYKIYELPDFLVVSVVNLIIAAVNSFPVSVLDCGRAVKSAFFAVKSRETSEKITENISYIFIVVFAVISTIYIAFYGVNISLIAINLYLFFITIIKKWS